MVKRAGFGLVEVIVAMTLLGIGIMSVAASAAFAARIMRVAHAEETAARAAALVVDSLSHTTGWSAGTTVIEGIQLVWDGGRPGEMVRVGVTGPAIPASGITFEQATLPLIPDSDAPPPPS